MQAAVSKHSLAASESRYLWRAIACKMNTYANTTALMKKDSTFSYPLTHFGLKDNLECTNNCAAKCHSLENTAAQKPYSPEKQAARINRCNILRYVIESGFIGQILEMNVVNWTKEICCTHISALCMHLQAEHILHLCMSQKQQQRELN
jgi:hypothetical protein